MTRILFDSRWGGSQGTDRVSREIRRRLQGVVDVPSRLRLFHPLEPLWLSLVATRVRPDVYFSPGFNPPLYSPAPMVFMIHDLNYVDRADAPDHMRRAYFEYLVKPACRRAAGVLTPSEYTRARVVEWAGLDPSRVTCIGAGVDPQFSADGPRYEPGFPYLLYVGNRLPHKNLPKMIEAFAAAHIGTDCHLVLTGHADEALLALARRYGVKARISFAGHVLESELPSLYRGALALVMPSLNEGFGLQVAEAMACGIPVAAAAATSLPEVAGGAALLFQPKDIDDIADALRRVVYDEDVRARGRQLGLQRSRAFTWDRTAQLAAAVIVQAASHR